MAEITVRSEYGYFIPPPPGVRNKSMLLYIHTPAILVNFYTESKHNSISNEQREEDMQEHFGFICCSAIQSIMLGTQINFSAVCPIFQSNVFFANIAQDSILPSHRPIPPCSSSKAVIILLYCVVCPTRSISMLGWGWRRLPSTSIQSDYYFKMKTIWQTII